jgi:SRSO17 transposase
VVTFLLTRRAAFDLPLVVKPKQLKKLERELEVFIGNLTADLGRPERCEALRLYMTGLLLDGERKSMQPLAARLVDSDAEVEAMRQRLQQAVVVSGWDDDVVRSRLAKIVQREMPALEVIVFDDTGFPKKGAHSVGVARQYSGTLGRTDNCQVATSIHVAGEKGSVCVGMQLYLPKEWTDDVERMRAAGVPETVEFKRKWEIALDLLERAQRAGVSQLIALADSGYGDAVSFRDGLRKRGLQYIVGVSSNHLVWPPGARPTKPLRIAGAMGRPRTVPVDPNYDPLSIEALVRSLPKSAFRRVNWREGARGRQSSRFACLRVHPAELHTQGRPADDEHWLICEWPANETSPSKFHLSSLPASTSVKQLVRLMKLRWRVERDYQELKGEIGLDHFEGRTWRGFHHHATLCAAAHAFLALRRALFPPQQSELDFGHGATPSPSRLAAPGRLLPTLPKAIRSPRAATRPLPHVIR